MVAAQEKTLKEAIQRLLTDSSIADVELEGTDGVRLPGCTGLLSARSEVFEQMLLGPFSESTEQVVKVGYPGSVLKKIVRYCYTDEVDLTMVSDTVTSVKDDVASSDQNEVIHDLLLLVDAANYFELTKLRRQTVERAKVLLKEHPEHSFWFLEEAKCVGCEEVLQEALKIIQSHLSMLLLSSVDSIRDLSQLSLMEVLQDNYSTCEEQLLYQLLEVWADDEHGQSGRRKVACEQLSKLIRLDLIPASVLDGRVAIGGLVEELDVFPAYRQQAKLSEKKMELLHSRSSRRWKSSMSTLLELDWEKSDNFFLASERLSSGIYQWTIRVENQDGNVFLGLGGEKNNFWLGRDGSRWRNTNKVGVGGLGFRSKSVVTMTLDFTRQDGTLAVSVDNSEPETLFTMMASADDTCFVPAVHVTSSGSALLRFVSIRKLA